MKIETEIINAFKEDDIDTIKEKVLKLSQEITKSLMLEDNESIEKLLDSSCSIRDRVESEEDIERNKEFFFGYLHAYENIASRLLEFSEVNDKRKSFIRNNPKFNEILIFLNKVKACRKDNLLKELNIREDTFDLLMSNQKHKVDMVTQNDIGSNVIISLTSSARMYLNK